jgi:signal transduction histidine kinase/CheY-like chemotaxis protein
MQFICVFSAFAIIAAVSLHFMYGASKAHLLEYGNKVMDVAESELRAELQESENTVNLIAYRLEAAIDSDASEEWTRALVKQAGEVFSENSEGGKYGVCAVVDDKFIIGTDFEFPEGYDYRERSWYKEALKNDDISFSEPYIGAGKEGYVVSISRALKDKSGKTRGVICADISLEYLCRNITAAKDGGGGYGFIADENFNFTAHRERDMVGRPIADETMKKSAESIIGQMRERQIVEAENYTDFNGDKSLIFMRRLWNGWYAGVVTPVAPHYEQARFGSGMVVVLSVVMALGLIVFDAVFAFRGEIENKGGRINFLTKMNHELRTPLNTVFGMAEIVMREEGISHNVRDSVLQIKHASNNLLSIINDILDYSKIESGDFELSEINYQLASIVNDVIGIVRLKLLDKPVKFLANVDSGIPNNLIGDESRVRQVIMNLLDNAVKFTDEGFVTLDITGDLNENDEIILTVNVTDTGMGIKKEYIRKLFTDFVQVGSVDKGIMGVGLGLTLARRICGKMKGDISVRSVYGEGSAFTATMRQRFEKYDQLAAVDNLAEKNVVIYDTREEYRANVERTMLDLNINCASAGTQPVFYEALKKKRYEYVFTAPYLFAGVRNLLNKLDLLDTKIVLLSEFGEVITAKCNRIIEMPTYCVPVANMLNDIITSMDFHEGKERHFTAQNASILIVDDITTNLRVAEGLMAPYGMNITTCKSGPEAIDLVKENNYDIVFMDYMMPGMNGLEATERIRGLEDGTGKFRNMTIIALTAVVAANAMDMFISGGMNDFIPKPIEILKLDLLLRKWLPLEKLERFTMAQEAAFSAKNMGDDAEVKILGVDTKKGIHMAGGSKDVYVAILEIFYRDCSEKIDDMNAAFEAKNMAAYASQIHALKSASANIGAIETSDFAKAMEEACQKHNLEFVRENHDTFIRQLKLLIKNIAPLIRQTTEEKTNDADGDNLNMLKQDLLGLKEALEQMDIGAVDGIIAELKDNSWSREVRNMIDDLSNCVLLFEYEKAVAAINRYLKG